jgi:23S rRNA (adenine2503-C2)-methyltransferase
MKIKVPTGYIGLLQAQKNRYLEYLSIGDYGKAKNVKAEFLGLMDEIEGVPHGDLLPLEEKWVITISSQTGCSMACNFCDVPKVGPGFNATYHELLQQVDAGLDCFPDVKPGRINLHFARMGEPTFNENVINASYYLRGVFEKQGIDFHPVVSTMMPAMNHNLQPFIKRWLQFREDSCGNAGLQLSINTTDHEARNKMFGSYALSLPVIAQLMRDLHTPDSPKFSRKIALNFALTGDEIDAQYLATLFDPKYFMCKLTPLHATAATNEAGHIVEGYTTYDLYRDHERNLINAGFDVIVFVPSKEEDESRITCGNAVLALGQENIKFED